jgi:hypothetical protein
MSDSIQLLAASFAQACTRSPEAVGVHDFTVGGAPVHAQIVGNDLARVFNRSLARGASGDGGLTMHLWDEGSTGVALPALPDPIEDMARGGPAGEWIGFTSDGSYLRFSGPDFEIHMDRSAQYAVGWIRSEALLSSWHRARPLQTLFVPWIADRGAAVVHAAMVARGGVGILFPGPAHSGKSTLTAVCGGDGFEVMGDDAIALEIEEGRVLGHCLHAAVKLRRAGLPRHPDLAGKMQDCAPPWHDEAVGFLGELFPGQVVPTAEVIAVGFPSLGHSPSTTFAEMNSGQAMRKLTGCLLSAEPGRVTQAFTTLGEILDRIPAYAVAVGTATSEVPTGISALFRKLEG